MDYAASILRKLLARAEWLELNVHDVLDVGVNAAVQLDEYEAAWLERVLQEEG